MRNGASKLVYSWNDLPTVWPVWFGNEYRIRTTDKVFVDLGANIGSFSSYICTSLDRTVFAVEPFPDNVLRLAEILQNEVKTGQCHILAQAVDWSIRRSNSPSIPSHSRSISSDAEGTIEVSNVTIPELVRLAGGSVDLLKVDIEGYQCEHELFQNIVNGDLSGVKRIALEFHGLNGHLILTELLNAHGFKLTYHKPQGTRGIAEFIRCL